MEYQYQCAQIIGGYVIPEHVLEALLSVAYDYMKLEFNKKMQN